MILRLQMQNCTAYATYHILHQQMKGTKWHKATNAKNGFVESAERYLVSHLKTYEKNGIVLFAVTDINSKNDKYMLSLTLSCPLLTKGHTHTWTNLQLLPFVTTRHERDKRDNFPRKSILDVFGNKSTPIIPNLPIFIASLNSCYHQF